MKKNYHSIKQYNFKKPTDIFYLFMKMKEFIIHLFKNIIMIIIILEEEYKETINSNNKVTLKSGVIVTKKPIIDGILTKQTECSMRRKFC